MSMDIMESNGHNHRRRKFINSLMVFMAVASGIVVILPLGLVLSYMLFEGASSLNLDFFTHVPAPTGDEGGGMANAIIGSIELMGMAVLFGAPIGVLGGIYLTEFGNERFNEIIRFLADALNGVPSIVWSIVIYEAVVVPMKSFSMLAGSLALGFMMIPLVIRTTEEVLALVPNSYREAALALGIPRWKIILKIVVSSAYKGIITAVLIAGARIAGETAPLLFTAFGNLNWNHSIFEPVSALPLQIFSYAIAPYDDWHRQAWAGALVLIGFVFLLNISIRILTRGGKTSPL